MGSSVKLIRSPPLFLDNNKKITTSKKEKKITGGFFCFKEILD